MKPRIRRPQAPTKTYYRVYIEQVNQTYVHVTATSPEEAAEKGYRKWRREDAHARVSSVRPLEECQ